MAVSASLEDPGRGMTLAHGKAEEADDEPAKLLVGSSPSPLSHLDCSACVEGYVYKERRVR